MHYKKTGFAKSRGRPPNNATTFFGIRAPSHDEAIILPICCLTLCHEKLFAVKRRWGDRPRIRDDTAAIVLVRIRGSDFQQDAYVQILPNLGCHLGDPLGGVCQMVWLFLRTISIVRSFRKKKPFLKINTARDWVAFTCTGEKHWKPVRDNNTSPSQDEACNSAKRRTGRGMPKFNTNKLAEYGNLFGKQQNQNTTTNNNLRFALADHNFCRNSHELFDKTLNLKTIT